MYSRHSRHLREIVHSRSAAMSVKLDVKGDFAAVADGTEAVRVLRRGSAPGSPGAEVPHALGRVMTTREAAESDGRYTAGDVVWHLPVAELDHAPRLGDVILDAAGRRFTVLEVQLVALRTRWRCIARRLAIVYALDDTVQILVASYAKSAAGAAEATFRTWKTGVRARIQPLDTSARTEHGARRSAARCRVLIEEDLALDHRHRIVAADGTAYAVVRSTAAERIGELCSVEVERLP
jgi:hypothetical protein